MGTKRLFTKGWSFCKTASGTTLEELRAGAYPFAEVTIPHDWLIYDANNLYEDSCGWYRKSLFAEEKKGRTILRFDGVYMDSTLYVNGKAVADWKYGYSTFDMDVTDFLEVGENELLLQVRHQSPNSRWYSGAGMYRNVWIQESMETFLPMDGTKVEITKKNGDFQLEVATEVEEVPDCRKPGNWQCRYRLWKDGAMVQELGNGQWVRAEEPRETEAALLARQGSRQLGDRYLTGMTQMVSDPKLWDPEHPDCYELGVELWQGKSLLDEQRYTIGFRTMEFDPEKGFLLNGQLLKVHGVCEHHDLGCLGAAFFTSAMERKFRILRGMGVNAIRTSHNMPDPQLMELADRMGFLVMNEAFDMWERSKTTYDYGRFFKEWARRDVASWIRRDRNHPSLMLWSIGNEIYDTHVDEHGQDITHRLTTYVREHDKQTAITIASNYMPWENAQKCADIVKIAGYNYCERYYEQHHAEHPDWVIYGSETASIVQSRGIYHFPLSQSILADEDEQCSALGNSATSWGARSIEKCITDDRDATFTFGQFLWTGFDYIGEPTPYHTKNSYFGHIDTAGFPKDSYYIFGAEWNDKAAPMVHLFPYWDFNEGQLIDVRACTNQPFVELFVNGVSQGRQEIDHRKGKKLLGDWQVPYQPGTILAVAYDENGAEVARDSHCSFGDSHSIRLTPDREQLRAGSEDLCFVTIETMDAEGHPVENAVDYVRVSVTGGQLLGLDNGDSTDYDSYKGNCRKLFSGKLLAVVGAGTEPGEIQITVEGEGLVGASLRIPVTGEGKQMIPVRKVELHAPKGQNFTPEQTELPIEAQIYPANAGAQELIWQVVNNGGVAVRYARVEPIPRTDDEEHGLTTKVNIKALGDGDFRVRCMVKDFKGKLIQISQLELSARGLGQSFLNPYEFISAGLFSDTVGQVGNGNEKGIATDADGVSGVIFRDVDFGEYGSDELTVPAFTLNDEAHAIDIWIGRPYETGSRLIDTVIYQKPSIWNTYQEETWKLPERLKGVVTIAFILHAMVHIKGFSFTRQQKAYGHLTAGEADRLYGDSFCETGEQVLGIGNNVTLEFGNMDFGEEGASSVTIWGRTPLSVNTIHISFTPDPSETGEQRESSKRIVEFKGNAVDTFDPQTFQFDAIKGSGKIEFIFLPGSNFDFDSFRFEK